MENQKAPTRWSARRKWLDWLPLIGPFPFLGRHHGERDAFGIDLGKRYFFLHPQGARGAQVWRKKDVAQTAMRVFRNVCGLDGRHGRLRGTLPLSQEIGELETQIKQQTRSACQFHASRKSSARGA